MSKKTPDEIFLDIEQLDKTANTKFWIGMLDRPHLRPNILPVPENVFRSLYDLAYLNRESAKQTVRERCISALLAHQSENWSAQQFATHLGISRASFYRLLDDDPICKAAWHAIRRTPKRGRIDRGEDSSGRPTTSVDGYAEENP
jgi:hypothetical protein